MPHQLAAKSQQLAAHPQHSAWVAASAGSGKTKVLTDRVLNLLLEGCPPERILCLTFTKAAAAEMASRVREKLGEWAIMPEDELQYTLNNLKTSIVSRETIEYARRLFTAVLDTPGGLKIQTVHSFCQSLLKRFPLEAGLSPFFEVVDDTEQKRLVKQAFLQIMEDPVFQGLILRFSEATFGELNEFILQERSAFAKATSPIAEEKDLVTTLLKHIPVENLRKAIALLATSSPTDQNRGQKLAQFLNLSQEEQRQKYENYLTVFLTKEGEKRARLVTQKAASLSALFEQEATRLERWLEEYNTLEIARLSQAFLRYSTAFLESYEKLKKDLSRLDYDDLILKTVALFKNPGCHWVLYKLDGGLDHILVDEAQDTNPAQWEVIRAIAEEFYANAATETRNRTLFIVGDAKQSIYSFQGADPTVFTQMQNDLRTFAHTSGKMWQDVDLTVSFRSTPEILAVVDAVFAPLQHLPFRKDAPGHVELWPLLETEKEESLSPWQARHQPVISPQKRLAELLATTIQGWCAGEHPLSPVHPGDILVLVRRRTSFVDTLIKALKEHNIPVAGTDRLWLLEGIAIQDLLKIGEFLLLPEDDLTLATVLKSPLFGLTEEDIFTLAFNRGHKSLWECLQKNTTYEATTALLRDLLSRVDFFTPFALFSIILGPLGGRQKWHARLGPEVLDSFDEFLNLCLRFQEEKTPSLQGFLHWVSQEAIELKRDFGQNNQVRIMTVHGSKGLQAPIVILPDTTQAPFDLPPFTFYENELIWLPPAILDTTFTTSLKQKLRDKQQEEYRRLLYVALTRAEDALYVCGWEANHQNTWYDIVKEGLQKIGEEGKDKVWRLCSTKTQKSDPFVPSHPTGFLLPHCLTSPPALEEFPKLLRPSEAGGEEEFETSTFGSFGTQRGVLIHKLLEILPTVEENVRVEAAHRFLATENVPEEIAREMVEKIQQVFKAYPDLFGPLSQGEVPIIGKLGNSVLSGQIDRLIMNEDHILILDYKTHQSIPKDVPLPYLKQMAIYQAALTQIYPNRIILCGLLWTQIPRLDILSEALLKKFTPSIDDKEGSLYTQEKHA